MVSMRCEGRVVVGVLASPSLKSFDAQVVHLSEPGLSLRAGGRIHGGVAKGVGAWGDAQAPLRVTRGKVLGRYM